MMPQRQQPKATPNGVVSKAIAARQDAAQYKSLNESFSPRTFFAAVVGRRKLVLYTNQNGRRSSSFSRKLLAIVNMLLGTNNWVIRLNNRN